jgi:uracil-DNA glycosylase family 4
MPRPPDTPSQEHLESIPLPRQLIQTRRAAFRDLALQIVTCDRCPRLRRHGEDVARRKKRMYRNETYWGRPAPGFGDPNARLLIIGLAPAAHGANRTGRVFTGDASGSWLYRELHHLDWSNLEDSRGPGDGLRLRDVYVTAAARCAPPKNRPTPEDLSNCRPYLVEELSLLRRVEVVLCLGRIAFDGYLKALAERGTPWPGRKPPFAHGILHRPDDPRLPLLITSYHPSRQNTQTGRLTAAMWRRVFKLCSKALSAS